MVSLIVSGGIGTGKSAMMAGFAGILDQRVGCFSADQAVSDLYQDEAFISEMKDSFGAGVLHKRETGDHVVNRQFLRQLVLDAPEKRAKLEKLTHGHVLHALEDARRKAGEQDAKVFVAEVPLHYEIGEVISADLVIVVAASRSVQVRRMMDNRGLDEATTRAFLDAQWPIEAKVEKADVVIWNDGDPSALERQTLLLANLLNIE